MRTINFGNPTDAQRFKVMMAIGLRQGAFQKELWRRLRAIMAEGRRDQGDALEGIDLPGSGWRDRYIKLLQRAVRHEQRMERTKRAGYKWIEDRRMKPRPPNLRLISPRPEQ